jgi:hypothetical protein
MNYDFRDHYSVGDKLKIITDIDTFPAIVTKVTAFCAHCRDNEYMIFHIARNPDGEVWLADTQEECEIEKY